MTGTKKSQVLPSVLTYDDVRAVSPALEHYTKGPLLDGLWKRPELSPRDRSVVTLAALIARMQTIEMPFHFALALDNGVKPGELSEIITHLAFYSGWANAMSAVAVAKDIFHQRGIGIDQLPPAKDKPLPLNEEAEKQRATQVSANFGATAPGLVREHDRPAVPRSLASPGTRAARPQLGYRECVDSRRPGCADHLSSRSSDGQRPHTVTGFRGADTHCLLRGLALRVFRFACRERRFRKAAEALDFEAQMNK